MSLKDKIKKGKFVELEKLIPKPKFKKKGLETKLEIVGKKNSQSYYLPLFERDNTGVINNFRTWERAFRAYVEIYTRAHPDRADELDELLQYINSIETAAETFAWNNVFAYDEVFHKLM